VYGAKPIRLPVPRRTDAGPAQASEAQQLAQATIAQLLEIAGVPRAAAAARLGTV